MTIKIKPSEFNLFQEVFLALANAPVSYLAGHAVKYLGKMICNDTLAKINPLALTTFLILSELASIITRLSAKKLGLSEVYQDLSAVCAFPVTYYLSRSLTLLTPIQAVAGIISSVAFLVLIREVGARLGILEIET